MNPTHAERSSHRGQVTVNRRHATRRHDEVRDEQLSADVNPASVARTWHWRHGLDLVRGSA